MPLDKPRVRRLAAGMKRAHLSVALLAAAGLVLCSCVTTSLSDPDGRGHSKDLSVFQLTGQSDSREVTEADIASARSAGGRMGSLPVRGARVLLVQSGAHQPDAELQAAYAPYCQVVPWDGRAPEAVEDDTGKAQAPKAGAVGRRLRLVAAQQGCSHVVVVFGEIQSKSKTMPTVAVSWVPVAGELIPTEHSGTRLLAQAIILETASTRYTTISAAPRQASGITTDSGANGINGRRATKLKAAAYPELARKSVRG